MNGANVYELLRISAIILGFMILTMGSCSAWDTSQSWLTASTNSAQRAVGNSRLCAEKRKRLASTNSAQRAVGNSRLCAAKRKRLKSAAPSNVPTVTGAGMTMTKSVLAIAIAIALAAPNISSAS